MKVNLYAPCQGCEVLNNILYDEVIYLADVRNVDLHTFLKCNQNFTEMLLVLYFLKVLISTCMYISLKCKCN